MCTVCANPGRHLQHGRLRAECMHKVPAPAVVLIATKYAMLFACNACRCRSVVGRLSPWLQATASSCRLGVPGAMWLLRLQHSRTGASLPGTWQPSPCCFQTNWWTATMVGPAAAQFLQFALSRCGAAQRHQKLLPSLRLSNLQQVAEGSLHLGLLALCRPGPQQHWLALQFAALLRAPVQGDALRSAESAMQAHDTVPRCPRPRIPSKLLHCCPFSGAKGVALQSPTTRPGIQA